MRTETHGRKLFVLAIAFVMIVSQLVTAILASAATVLPVAQYVKSEGTVENVAANTAKYNGKVTINVPMTRVLGVLESEMQTAANAGLYPHGKDGRNQIAYIEYNVTFPENVDIGTITKTNTASMIDGNRIDSTVNGRTVNFKIHLKDVNWAGILNFYNADKADPDAHTVKLEIPYSITANSKAEAEKFESEKITAKGDFSTYPSGFSAALGIGIQTFVTDIANIPFTGGLPDSPSFPEDHGTNSLLEGDLTIGSDTEHDNVMTTSKDAIFDMTGVLNVKPIKDEMKRLENTFQASYAAGVTIENLETEFEASLTLPNGLEFKDANPEVEVTGTNGIFEIKSQNVNNDKIKIKLGLKNPASYTTYNLLSTAINRVDDKLNLTVKGIKFADSATPNTSYTMTGYLGGTFKAKATNAANKTINFDYKWTAKQSANGADAIAPNDLDQITYTVKYSLPAEVVMQSEEDLMGDILIGNETEHDAVYVSKKNAKHEFTGLLDVKPIKDKMVALENFYNNPLGNQVTLSDIDTTFTSSLELPAEMEFTSPTPTATLEGANGVFKITNVQKIGNKVTVTIKLARTYVNYDDLSRDIKSVDDSLKVKLDGAVFTSAAKLNTNYTVKGKVSGAFSGKAIMNSNGKAVRFDFKWKGKQLPEGADAIAPTDYNNITFTLKYTDSVKPNKPNTGDTSNLPIYLAVAGLAGLGIVAGMISRRKKQK